MTEEGIALCEAKHLYVIKIMNTLKRGQASWNELVGINISWHKAIYWH